MALNFPEMTLLGIYAPLHRSVGEWMVHQKMLELEMSKEQLGIVYLYQELDYLQRSQLSKHVSQVGKTRYHIF